jgi:hypothetical protein
MHLLIEDHRDSIEKIERGGLIIKMVGKGVMKSPGHPGGNQCFQKQVSLLKPPTFPIYNKDLNNRVEYLGRYKVLNYEIKLSNAGFKYYLFTMMRVRRNKPGEVHEFPPL